MTSWGSWEVRCVPADGPPVGSYDDPPQRP
jgi:hypothetical protein